MCIYEYVDMWPQTPLTPHFSKIYGKNGARSTSILLAWPCLAGAADGRGLPATPDEKIVTTPYLVGLFSYRADSK